MDRNFARALPLVLKHEGGWADHPDDPGGATMKGVTLATFRRYVKADGTKADLKAISDEQIATVFYRHYWAAVNAQALPSGVDYAVFDFAVNSGPARAAKYLQSIVGANVDGRVGPQTIAAVSRMEPSDVINRLCDARMDFLRKLEHWPTFGKGWTRRVSDVRKDAVNMIGRSADVERVPVPVPRPTVPAEVEQKVKEKTGFWQKVTGFFGAGGVGGGLLWGVDWQAIAVIAGAAILVLLIFVLLQKQIVSAVRHIKGAVEGQGT
ncbi:glycoside hydrolase family 108 protein [uncultured Nitratireductor sp.]|uniref:glycoside hydrolase family 108 protein n=1 Tax=uncultured Nitratireductor sp. TaxID=520953 RepID=UPI0025F916E2|nr:glycoside hydrolase family 108 protein [uncultured Nitratireductor sp.]